MKLYSLLLVLLLSCSASKNLPKNNNRKQIISNGVSYELLAQSAVGGFDVPQIKVIKEQKALEEVFGYVNRIRKPGFVIPTIDFEKETIVAVFMGKKTSGGYSVSIDQVKDVGDEKIEVTVQEEKPKKGEMVTMAITQPFCIVKLNTDKELIFKKK